METCFKTKARTCWMINHKPESDNITTLTSSLKLCTSSEHLENGRRIHSTAAENGYDSNSFVATALVKMYIKCGSIVEARRVFDRIPCPDVVSWTCIISGYIQSDEHELALELFQQMHHRGCLPNSRTFIAAVKACSGLATRAKTSGRFIDQLKMLEMGFAIHVRAADLGFESDLFLATSLINMYGEFGCLSDARRVFQQMPLKNTVVWNSLMLTYAENGSGLECLELFSKMSDLGRDCSPDVVSYFAALKACIVEQEKCNSELKKDEEAHESSSLRWLETCMAIHREASKRGFDSEKLVSISLVELYSRCRSLIDAQRVFDMMSLPDAAAWTSLISGYLLNEEPELGLTLFTRTESLGCRALDSATLTTVLKACSKVLDMNTARHIQAHIHRNGLPIDPALATGLVDFYSKCGRMTQAEHLFDSLCERDLITWNAFIAGLSRQGDWNRVLEQFERLKEEGLRANGSTFVSVLTACSHAGLVEKGKKLFDSMRCEYGFHPGLDHLICIADLLGRAGDRDSMVELLRSAPLSAQSWNCVLAASRKLNNSVLGRIAFQALLQFNHG